MYFINNLSATFYTRISVDYLFSNLAIGKLMSVKYYNLLVTKYYKTK